MKEATDLNPSYIANCVFNAFSSYTAIMLNVVTIYAIRKTTSLPKPLKTFLLSLGISDLGVGLFVQPLYTGHLVLELELEQNSENIFSAWYITANLLAFASLFGVMALSADRFLAIHLHLRYQELVTHKRVVAVVISIWMLSAIISMVWFWDRGNIVNVIMAIINAACIITTTFLNYKIYVAVRRHAHQIDALQVHQVAENDEMANVGRLRKSAIATVYVYLVFLVCYLPVSCTLWINALTSESNTVVDVINLYFLTLVFLNSSLNPLIYCWNMREIRHNIVIIFRNALLCYNGRKL